MNEMIRQFHHEWIYDLYVMMDGVMDDFNIQYEECSIDVEKPPIFSFFEENCGLCDVFYWFSIIIEHAFGYREYEYDPTLFSDKVGE